MLSMNEQSKRGNGETMSVVKAHVTICSYMNFTEGTDKIHYQSHYYLRRSAYGLFAGF